MNSLTPSDLQKAIESEKAADFPSISGKDRMFGIHYVGCYNVKEAASAAGVTKDYGANLLRNPIFCAFVQEVQRGREAVTLISKDFATFHWLKLLPKLMGEEEVPMVDKEGDEFMAKKFHSNEVVAALKEINKMAGVVEETKSKGKGGGAVSINLNFGNVMGPAPAVEISNGEVIEHE